MAAWAGHEGGDGKWRPNEDGAVEEARSSCRAEVLTGRSSLLDRCWFWAGPQSLVWGSSEPCPTINSHLLIIIPVFFGRKTFLYVQLDDSAWKRIQTAPSIHPRKLKVPILTRINFHPERPSIHLPPPLVGVLTAESPSNGARPTCHSGSLSVMSVHVGVESVR